jgi:hypothetical protein
MRAVVPWGQIAPDCNGQPIILMVVGLSRKLDKLQLSEMIERP